MTQNITIDTPHPLTDRDLDEVRQYALSVALRRERLAASTPGDAAHQRIPRAPATVARDGQVYIDVEQVSGMFEWFDPDVSSVDLVHEALEAEVRKYDKYFE